MRPGLVVSVQERAEEWFPLDGGVGWGYIGIPWEGEAFPSLSLCHPVSGVGLVPAVKPKEVTFIGEIKGHAR